MTRDHYKGIPKKRAVLLDSDGNLEALEKGGDTKRIKGTATLTAGTFTVSGSKFVSDAYAFISTKHPYPTESGINWFVGDGFLTVSGCTTADFTIAYEVCLP